MLFRGNADPAVMLYWLRQAAQQNNLPALVSLGVLVLNGDSVPLYGLKRIAGFGWLRIRAMMRPIRY